MRLHPTFGAIATTIALLQAGPSSAFSCDELRSDVEAKIRASGVSAFSVSVVDASAPSAGRVVGTCDRGAKKLLYTQTTQTTQTESGTAPRNLPAKAERKVDTIITECKDGSEPVRGQCRK
ncbi:DUF1161 domain-containing protein [uncultured Sphaerotilus sp.]|uniref:DUF1161 domain-containing protein n=1 Tax=uncultured Sphaerotilus sp. TaxID=474984 RepID=UPI0030CA4036